MPAKKSDKSVIDSRDDISDDFMEERGEQNDVPTSGLLRRLIEEGMGALKKPEEGGRNYLSALTLPKELGLLFINQADRAKQEIVNLFGREFSRFLDATDISDEIVKALSRMSIEINAEVRFKAVKPESAASGDAAKPESRIRVKVNKEEK